MAFEITNYFEPLVAAEINRYVSEHFSEQEVDLTLLEDAACIALNQLPARYLRHHVDAYFYLTQEQREQLDQQVARAVEHAFAHLAHDPYGLGGIPGRPAPSDT